ncbi:protein kinase [Streptomyces sp. SYP-A7185]|uniref:protein kinase n=1 Tax=Streptomyces sp. SYP-A7185 TaxID=3040076 RepID=UPI0038F613D9
MDEYAGRVLADRYRLPLPPADEYELAETRAFDTYSGQEVLVRQVPLPEVVDAEVLELDERDLPEGELPAGFVSAGAVRRPSARTTRRPSDPAVRRAIEAAQAAAQIPDHPRLDQVFDVFAEGGSLWIVSELVAARPLAALLAEEPLSPYRAAEVASDVVTALRVLHAHGWVHRNITARTVLLCDDGRVVLTGLAAGAAEEALCGYDPRPEEFLAGFESGGGAGSDTGDGADEPDEPDAEQHGEHGEYEEPPGAGGDDGSGGPAAIEAAPVPEPGDGTRAPRTSAIAAYRAGARAAARLSEDEGRRGPASRGAELPGPRTGGSFGQSLGYGEGGAPAGAEGREGYGEAGQRGYGAERDGGGEAEAAGRILDPYGVAGTKPWHGAVPRGRGTDPEQGDTRRPEEGTPDRGESGYGGQSFGSGSAGQSFESRNAGQSFESGHGGQGAGSGYGGGSEPGPGYGGGSGRGPGYDGGSGHAPGYGGETERGPGYDGGSRRGPGHGGGTGRGPGLDAAGGESGRVGQGAGHGSVGTAYGRGPALSNHGGPGSAAGHAGDSTGAPASRHQIPGQAGQNRSAPSLGAPGPTGGRSGQGAPGAPGAQLDRERQEAAPAPASSGHSYWDALVAERSGTRRGPATALAAERARHARMTVVGGVTERWAPEQAGPVHENWQLAPPIGPATDLWALGALLFRAVQGHAPYPEESTFELVQLVCAEPPAFAEECGPLRPVVESLLRQDPTERLDIEELSGWLRSLVRSAPEPEAGVNIVPAPPFDAKRLPVVRRRGEVVRRKKRRAAAPAATPAANSRQNGRRKHKHKRGRDARPPAAEAMSRRSEAPPMSERTAPMPVPGRTGSGRPRSLGRLLLILILVGLVAAIAYAMVFLPKAGENSGSERAGSAGDPGTSQAPDPGSSSSARPSEDGTSDKPSEKPDKPDSQKPQTSNPEVPQGFTVRKDAEGFRVAVASGWDRQPKNGRGQVVYTQGDFELIVVPGRDSTEEYGGDPMKYQREHERELQPFRDSTWAESSGMRRIDVGGRVMGEGQFTWQAAGGGEIFVRNLAMIVGGKYHVVQVRGPEGERDKVDRLYEQASSTYQVTD